MENIQKVSPDNSVSQNSNVKFKVYQKDPNPEYSHTIIDRITIWRVVRDHILNQRQQQSWWYPLVNDTKEQYYIRKFIWIIDWEEVYAWDIFEYEYFDAIWKKRYSNWYIWLEKDELRYVLFIKDSKSDKCTRYVELSQITSHILWDIFENPELMSEK